MKNNGIINDIKIMVIKNDECIPLFNSKINAN